jgi:primosomal protein N'
MPRPRKIQEEQRKAIAQALREGIKPLDLAKEYNVSKGTIQNIAKEHEIDIVQSITKRANEARTIYTKTERGKLLDRFFDKIDEVLKTATDANDIRNLSIAMGTIIDKKRLEEGEATERTEVNGNDARERFMRRIDQLAERRGKKAVSGQ